MGDENDSTDATDPLAGISEFLDELTEKNRETLQEKHEQYMQNVNWGSEKPTFGSSQTGIPNYECNYNDEDIEVQNKFKMIKSITTTQQGGSADERSNVFINSSPPAGPRIYAPGTGAAFGTNYKSIQVLMMESFANNETYRMTSAGYNKYGRFFTFDPGIHTTVEGTNVHNITDAGNPIQAHFLNDVFGLSDWNYKKEKNSHPPKPTDLHGTVLFEYAHADYDGGLGKWQQYAFIPLSVTREADKSPGEPNFLHMGETSDFDSLGWYSHGYSYDHHHKTYFGMHLDALSWVDWMNMDDSDYNQPWQTSWKKRNWDHNTLSDTTLFDVLKESGKLKHARRPILNYPDGWSSEGTHAFKSTPVFTHACDHPAFYRHLKTEDGSKNWLEDYYLPINGFNSPQAYGCRNQAGNSGTSDNYPVNMKRSAAGWDAIYGGSGARKGDTVTTHEFVGGKTGNVFKTDHTQKKYNYVLVEYVLCEAMQEQLSRSGSRFDGLGAIYEKCPLVDRDGKIYIQTKNVVWWKQLFPWWFSSSEMPGDVFPGLSNMPPDNSFFSWVNIWGGGAMESCESCGKDSDSLADTLTQAIVGSGELSESTGGS